MKKLNRKWVKYAALIFVLIMGFLLFLSNTIMNFSLPEVVTQQPTVATIANVLRTTAMAEARGSIDIEVDTAREVFAVYVRDGDSVLEGDALFSLEAGGGELQAQLDELRLQYQRMLLELSESDHAMQNETIRQIREDLALAQTDRNALGTFHLTEGQAQAALDQANTAVANLESQISSLETELLHIDGFSVLSQRIGQWVVAYEQAKADFLANVGQTYEDFREENPTASNQWTQAVATARTTMTQQAATARAAVVSDIARIGTDLTTANSTQAQAQQNMNRVQSIQAADSRVRELQRALNQALISLQQDVTSAQTQEALRLLDLRALEEDIEELEAKIQRQVGDTEGDTIIIRAQHDGIITNIMARVGQVAQPDIPLASLEVAQLGYTAEASFPAAEVQQVRPGAQVDVRTLGWWSELSGRVTGIRPDPMDPAARRIVNVEIQGDVLPGEQVNMSIHLSSARYDTVVPRSAVAQDATGYHVYILQTRTSPFGTRYSVMRVDVTILAEDDNLAAISGAIDRFANIIIRSSDTLTDRARVRLANE